MNNGIQQHQNPIVVALRWIVFIPGGFLASILAGIVAAVFVGGGLWMTGHSFDAPLTHFISSYASGYTNVAASARIAPTPAKTIPAVIVAVLMILVSGVVILVRAEERRWFGIAEVLSIVIGTTVAMVQHIQEDRKSTSTAPA